MREMSRVRKIVAGIDFVLAAILLTACFYLLTGTLHPDPDDRHGGAYAVLAGFFYLPLPISFLMAGILVRNHAKYAAAFQAVPIALLLALFVAVFWNPGT